MTSWGHEWASENANSRLKEPNLTDTQLQAAAAATPAGGVIGTPIPGSTLCRVRAGDIALHAWFGIYAEEPPEDPNALEGVVVEKANGQVRVQRAGEFATYREDEPLVVTWAAGIWPPVEPRNYQVAITRDFAEAVRIISWFQAQGIPMAPETSRAFGFSLNTDHEHFYRAMELYDGAGALVNVISRETVRTAVWNQADTVVRGGLGYDFSRQVFEAVARSVSALGFQVVPRASLAWHGRGRPGELVLMRSNDIGGVTEVLWLSDKGEISTGAMLASPEMLRRHFGTYKRHFRDPAIKQALDALRTQLMDVILDPTLAVD